MRIHGPPRRRLPDGPPRISGVTSRLRADNERGDTLLSPNLRAAPGSRRRRRGEPPPLRRRRPAAPLSQFVPGPRSPASRGASPPICGRPSLSSLAWRISPATSRLPWPLRGDAVHRASPPPILPPRSRAATPPSPTVPSSSCAPAHPIRSPP
ncbi:hypothetical protein PVAP13_1KG206177 [Panicum virgatum]|uniref:Uncharacterized protein n=1 Tax=Panicum virgatum TaxID=38727 RepID=A0A8T0XAU8_PANVG|nr:hypothetical protein PVAP13_1KG206177 [Panicum virgatum]